MPCRVPLPLFVLACLVGLASSVCTGCKSKPELVLHDSEQRAFHARCEPSGACSLEQTSGPRWAEPRTRTVPWTSTRVVGVCSVEASGEVESPADCRALVCQTDANCPPAHGRAEGTCLNGLCTDESHTLEPVDSVMLCLFGTGLGHDAPPQVERFAMGQHCGKPCVVPSTCRQP